MAEATQAITFSNTDQFESILSSFSASFTSKFKDLGNNCEGNERVAPILTRNLTTLNIVFDLSMKTRNYKR